LYLTFFIAIDIFCSLAFNIANCELAIIVTGNLHICENYSVFNCNW